MSTRLEEMATDPPDEHQLAMMATILAKRRGPLCPDALALFEFIARRDQDEAGRANKTDTLAEHLESLCRELRGVLSWKAR